MKFKLVRNLAQDARNLAQKVYSQRASCCSDVLVNNIGSFQPDSDELMHFDDYQQAMVGYGWLPLYTIQAALPF